MKFSIIYPYTNFPLDVYISDWDQLLAHLKHMNELKEKCLSKIMSKEMAKFRDNDCRIVMYSQLASIIYTYYRNILMIFFLKRVSGTFLNGEFSSFFPDKQELDLYHTLNSDEEIANRASIIGQEKQKLIFSLWMVLEDNIDFIYSSLVTEEESQYNKSQLFNRIYNSIKDNSPEGFVIPEKLLETLKEKFHSDYVQIGTKYDYVLKQLNLPKKTLSKIRSFLEFVGAQRNSMHYNSRPLKDRKFSTPIGKFTQNEGKHSDIGTFENLEKMIEYMLFVFDQIVENLNYTDPIINTVRDN